ncbi:DNA-deoxyinosine glycosylase [Bacillota bacterium Meth-B3]
MERVFSYEAVYRADARLLILGTAPSVQSLQKGFYYAHPQNAFWKILADVLGCERPTEIAQKKALLIGHRIALWDVAHSCARPGSMDADIRDVTPNDIPALLARCPGISRVLLNGGTAFALYRRHFAALPIEAVRLPSTSPAYTLPYAQKRERWAQALLGGSDAKPQL